MLFEFEWCFVVARVNANVVVKNADVFVALRTVSHP